MRADRLAAALAASVAALAAGPGAAAPAGKVDLASVALEDLLDLRVEAVTRHGERSSEAPAWVFVLTGEDLRRQGVRTLHDALRTVPGLFAYADGLYPMIGVRGVGLLSDYTTRLLVLVDGHRMNNSVGIGQSYLGPDLPVPLSAIERIEVIEGPVGSVYGPTAFLGVVNVVTRAPGAAGAGAFAAAEAAQGGASGATLEAHGAGDVGPVAVAVAVSGWRSAGFDWTFPELALDPDRDVPPDGVVRDADDGRAQSVYARLAWRGLELATACGEARRGIPSSPYSALVGDEGNWLRNRSCFAQLGWSGEAAADLGLRASVSYDVFRFDDAFAYAAPPEDVGSFQDRAYDRWVTAELRGDWEPSHRTRVSAGLEAEAHRTTQRAWAEDPTVGAGPIDKDFLTLNAYVLADGTVRERLRLHAGLTFHAHELFGSRLTPKVAAVWRASPRDVLKAVYSHGFRAPTAAEAFYEDGTDFLANPDLRPETAASMELVWERQLRDVAAVTVSGFRNVYRDLIRFVTVPAPGLPGPPDPANPEDFRQQGRNVDALRTFGGQVGLTVRLPQDVAIWGGLSAQGADGGRPANFPALTASASVSSRWPWRPLTLSLSAAAISSRRKDETALQPGARAEVPAAVVGSAAAALEVPGVRGLSLELSVHGLGGSGLAHPVTGDFTPLTEIDDQPAPLLRAGVRWTP